MNEIDGLDDDLKPGSGDLDEGDEQEGAQNAIVVRDVGVDLSAMTAGDQPHGRLRVLLGVGVEERRVQMVES